MVATEVLSNGKFVSFDKNGHIPFLEEATRFNDQLVAFLGGWRTHSNISNSLHPSLNGGRGSLSVFFFFSTDVIIIESGQYVSPALSPVVTSVRL